MLSNKTVFWKREYNVGYSLDWHKHYNIIFSMCHRISKLSSNGKLLFWKLSAKNVWCWFDRDVFYLFSDTRLLILMGCRSADWRPSSISLSPFRSPIETMLHLLSFVNVENCPLLNQSVIYRWHLKNWSPKPSKSCADASLRQYIERKHEYVTNWNEK